MIIFLFQSLLVMLGAQSSLCHCVSFLQFHICQFFYTFYQLSSHVAVFYAFYQLSVPCLSIFSSLCQFFMAFLGNVCWDLGLGLVGFPDSPLSLAVELRCC